MGVVGHKHWSWGAQGATLLPLACTEEVAATCSLPQVHGQKAAWEDPVEWVRDTLPWPSAQQDQSKLYHLPPPTIGPHSAVSPPEERTVKDTTPSSLDSDPLVGWPKRGSWEEPVAEQGWSFQLISLPLILSVKKPDLGMQKHFVFPGGAVGSRVMALAGELHTGTRGDMPVKGHVTLHEASCPPAEPQTGTHVLLHVLMCHLERLLVDQLPLVMAANAALAYGVLSIPAMPKAGSWHKGGILQHLWDLLYPLRSFQARLIWEGKEGPVASPVTCRPPVPTDGHAAQAPGSRQLH